MISLGVNDNMKLPAHAVVAIIPDAMHEWLDGMTKAGFSRDVVVRFAIEELMARDRKELLQAIVVRKDEWAQKGELLP